MLDGLRNIFIESLKFCKSKVAYDILVEKWNKECEEVYKYKQSLIAEEQAKHKPTADVEDVVRCSECKHWHKKVFDPIIEKHIGECHCSQWENDCLWYETSENDFCSYGKGKQE